MLFDEDYVEALAKRAQSEPGLAGYYHSNHRIDVDGRRLLVRLPLADAKAMDLRIWGEAEILDVVLAHGIKGPRVLGFSRETGTLIEEFIAGTVIEDRWPRGTRLPTRLLDDVLSLFRGLASIPSGALPPLPANWPPSGDSPGLLRKLMDDTDQLLSSLRPEYDSLYEAVGLPFDALSALQQLPANLGSSRFVMCHCDAHRGNSIVRRGSTVFLDWENALYGDFAYEVATHLHKTAYQPDEEGRLLERMVNELPEASAAHFFENVSAYRTHERVKSIVVDTVRYRERAVSTGKSGPPVEALAARLGEKLRLAADIWGTSPPSQAVVEEALRA